jgi:hypothetical protein
VGIELERLTILLIDVGRIDLDRRGSIEGVGDKGGRCVCGRERGPSF